MGLVSDKLIAAVFFLPKNQPQNQPIEVLLEKAGASDIKYDEGWLWDCQWAGMTCDAYAYNELASYQLLVIRFMFGIFAEKGKYSHQENNLPLEKDGNLQLALAFRDACETLKPEVAYITTRLPYGEFEKIVENVESIETYDPDSILDNAGLIYVKGIIADWLTYPQPLEPQDTLPVKEGLLVFSGTGRERWW